MKRVRMLLFQIGNSLNRFLDHTIDTSRLLSTKHLAYANLGVHGIEKTDAT